MKLKGFFAELNFASKAAIKAVDNQVKLDLFRAWDAWVTTFIKIVPVWTGQSVGTILPLANLLSRPVPIDAPKGSAPSNQSSVGAAQSSATLSGGDGRWFITYQTSLRHLIVNEQIDATVFGFHLKNPGPYNFQEQAGNAFIEAAKQSRLPDLTEFFDFDKRAF